MEKLYTPMNTSTKQKINKETPEVTEIFGSKVWNEAGQRLIAFCKENTWS